MAKNFLHQKYPDLQKSSEVENAVRRAEVRSGKEIPNDAEQRLNAYLARLEEIFEPADQSKRQTRVDILKDKLYESFVVKPEEVPEGYFTLQQRIAREQGHGHIEISKETKQQMVETVINDQKQSLDAWVDYLGSTDALYPAWFKYFVFRNIVKLGIYDKEKKEFRSRSKGTTSLFPDINREALAYVGDELIKKQKGEKGLKDPEWQKLLDQTNFAKLYAYAIEKVTPASQEQKEVIAGQWVKYDQGSDSTPLCASLQGHGTGWCTAGESVAKTQLEAGDFYVYYSTDVNGKNTVPRVAIRMQGNQIAEVRGINAEQNLEPKLIDVAEKKMAVLPGADKYKKKSADMKRLTEIEKMIDQGLDLTKDELAFLYEIKGTIEGFGHQEDPRIQEMREKRNTKKDYALIFDCSEEQIALNPEDLNDQTVVLIGNLGRAITSRWQEMPKNLKHIGGYAVFENSEITNLGQLQSIGGAVSFKDSKITDLGQLQSIGGYAYFENSEITNLGQLQSIGGNAYFENSEITNLGQLQSIGGYAYFENSEITDLGQLQSIGGKIYIDKDQKLDFSKIKHGEIKII